MSTNQQQPQPADPIGAYLDLRLDMIYGGHTDEEWNTLDAQAKALRSQFTHEELLQYKNPEKEANL